MFATMSWRPRRRQTLPDLAATIRAPSMRNNTQFDAGAKYHVAGDVGYVRYFTAFIYEFQFYRELCLVSGRDHNTIN